jgi:hypothetical protein
MPSLTTNGESHDASFMQSIPSDHDPAATVLSSAQDGDRILRLEQSIHELKRLLTGANSLPQALRSHSKDNRPPESMSTGTKRTYSQIIDPNERTNQDTRRFRFVEDNIITFPQDSLLRPVYAHPRQPTPREASLPPAAPVVLQESMLLHNCKSGRCILPPPDDGSALLNEYLHDFNSRIPLFQPEAIYNHIRECYSGDADAMPLKWVLAYIVLGIGHRLRAMSLFAKEDDTSNAEWYLNKCLAVLPDLLMHEPTLPLIQGLLGVSVLLRTSNRSSKAALFVSTAVRMAQDLAYNEASLDGNDGEARDEQEANVFWIAFFMDTGMNLLAMRPNTQRLVDISVPMPNFINSRPWLLDVSEVTLDQIVNFFPLHVSLSLIQAEALEDLFSVRARQRAPVDIAATFRNIVSELELWKPTNPLSGKNGLIMLNSMYRSDVVHSVILEASYFGTLYQLHTANAIGDFSLRVDVFSPDNLRTTPGTICLDIYADARRLLEFAAVASQGNVSVTW